MSKVKLLSIISIGLLAVNLFMIWFFISHKPPHNRKKEPKKIVIEKLHLDGTQISEYEKLIDWHKENIRKSEHQMMTMKNQLYASLQEWQQTISTDSLITEIGKVQMEIEHINYRHFQDIKKICKPDQLESYDALCMDIAKLFAPKQMPSDEK